MKARRQVIWTAPVANEQQAVASRRSKSPPMARERQCHPGSLLFPDSNTRLSITVDPCHFLTTGCHFLFACDYHFVALNSSNIFHSKYLRIMITYFLLDEVDLACMWTIYDVTKIMYWNLNEEILSPINWINIYTFIYYNSTLKPRKPNDIKSYFLNNV